MAFFSSSQVWYETAGAGEPLDQGDLIEGCPTAQWKNQTLTANAFAHGSTGVNILCEAIEIVNSDIIVMTQTCDLAQRRFPIIMACPHYSLDDYMAAWEREQTSRGQNISAKSRRRHLDDIEDGYTWNLSMLNSGTAQDFSTGIRIVTFHEVFSLPRDFLESWLQAQNQPRLRLLPPYREHLSQAFARFFMRVGLPTPIDKTW